MGPGYFNPPAREVLADPAFQAKVKAEMQKLQKDEAFYEYLRAPSPSNSLRFDIKMLCRILCD